jgi:small-conductance mechanosensitive channel
MAAAFLLTAFVLLVPAAAEPGSDSDPAGFEAIRLLLERVEVTLKREGLSAQTLYDLGRTLSPARDELHGRIADLEPKFAQIEERLKKLGPPPAKDAPPENPALAEERARLNQELSEIEAPLKQARSLAARADQISEQITEKRRDAYARQLFEQSPSVLSPSLWLDSAHALRGEIGDLVYELRAWADLLRAPENLSRTGVAMLASLAICVAVFLLRRWLWRHGAGAPGTPTRFGKAVAALGVILRIMLVAPLMTVAVIAVLETLQLLPHHLIELAHGLAAAVGSMAPTTTS